MAPGYEPRNFTLTARHVQIAEAVADELVAEVTLELDDEAVVAETLARRPRFDPREVDVARRERAEDLIETARAVTALETGDRGPVVTGRIGNPAPASTRTNRVWLP